MNVKVFSPAFWDKSRVFQLFQIARQGTTVLIGIFLAKSAVSLEDIGQYEQLHFLGYTLTFFWLNGLLQGFVVRYPQLGHAEHRSFEKKVGGFFLLLAFALGTTTWMFSHEFSQLFTGGVVQAERWKVFSIFFFSYQASSLVEHTYLVRNQVRGLVQWMICSSALMLLGFLLPIWWTGSLDAGLNGLAGFGLFRLVWFWLLVRPSWQWAGDFQLMAWFRTSLPLIGYAIAGGTAVVVDGWIINRHFQDAQVFAIYRYGARELPFTLAIAAAIGTAAISRLVVDRQAGMQELRDRVARLCHWLFPVSAVLMLTSTWWFVRLFNPEFVSSTSIFNIYLLILISRMVFSGTILMSLNATGVIFMTGLFELLVNVVLSLIFVRYWGIQGVAWATIVAYSFEKMVHVIYLARNRGIAPSSYIPVPVLGLYSVGLLVVYALS